MRRHYQNFTMTLARSVPVHTANTGIKLTRRACSATTVVESPGDNDRDYARSGCVDLFCQIVSCH